MLRPGGARPGDRLLLTKAIALEGTALLAAELRDGLTQSLGADLVERSARLLVDPGISVVADAEVLLDAGGVTALHDPTEGGLATGVRELAHAAGCGATLLQEAVPVLPETSAIADQLGLEPLGMLASGSLLVAAEPDAVAGLVAAGRRNGISVTTIGEVTNGDAGFVLVSNGARRDLPLFPSDEVTRVL